MRSLLWALPGKILALVAGIYYYRRLQFEYRLILLQVALAFIAECFGEYLIFQHQYNTWSFNIYILADMLLTGWCARLLLAKYKYSYLVTYMLAFLTVWWVIEIYDHGIFHWATLFFTGSCVLLVSLYIVVLFNKLLFTKKIIKEPAFWLSISVILYFGCCLPYFGMLNYLVSEKSTAAKQLWVINRWLNFSRYPLIAVCFITAGMQQKKVLKPA